MLKIWFQHIFLIELKDVACSLFGSINKPVQVKVIRMYIMFPGKHFFLNPIKKALPVVNPNKNNRKPGYFSGLDKRDSFKRFIHCAKASRKYNKPLRVLHKHYLPDKKVIKLQNFIPVDIF